MSLNSKNKYNYKDHSTKKKLNKLRKRKTRNIRKGKRRTSKRTNGKRKTRKRKISGGVESPSPGQSITNPNNIKVGDLVELNEALFDEKIKDKLKKKYNYLDESVSNWAFQSLVDDYHKNAELAKRAGWNNKYFIVIEINDHNAKVFYATPDMIANYNHIKTTIKNMNINHENSMLPFLRNNNMMKLKFPLFTLKHVAKKYDIEYYLDFLKKNKYKYEDNSTIESKNVWYCYAHGADVAEELDGQEQDIILRDDQIVITNCRPLSLTFPSNIPIDGCMKDVPTSMETFALFDQKMDEYKHEQRMCVFRNKVPNISLQFYDENKYYNMGLYKMPLQFEENTIMYNKLKKQRFIIKNGKINPHPGLLTFNHAFAFMKKPIPLLSEAYYSNFDIKKSNRTSLKEIQEGGNRNCSPNCKMTLKEMLHNTRTRNGKLLINTPFTLFVLACRADIKNAKYMTKSYEDQNLNFSNSSQTKFGDPLVVEHDDFDVKKENYANRTIEYNKRSPHDKYNEKNPMKMDPNMFNIKQPKFSNESSIPNIKIQLLDNDWYMIHNLDNRKKIYWNTATKETSMNEPIPDDWYAERDEEGRLRFINKYTGKTSYDKPEFSRICTYKGYDWWYVVTTLDIDQPPIINPNRIKVGDVVEINELNYNDKIQNLKILDIYGLIYKMSNELLVKIQEAYDKKIEHIDIETTFFIVVQIDLNNSTALILQHTPDSAEYYYNNIKNNLNDMGYINNILNNDKLIKLKLPLYKLNLLSDQPQHQSPPPLPPYYYNEETNKIVLQLPSNSKEDKEELNIRNFKNDWWMIIGIETSHIMYWNSVTNQIQNTEFHPINIFNNDSDSVTI